MTTECECGSSGTAAQVEFAAQSAQDAGDTLRAWATVLRGAGQCPSWCELGGADHAWKELATGRPTRSHEREFGDISVVSNEAVAADGTTAVSEPFMLWFGPDVGNRIAAAAAEELLRDLPRALEFMAALTSAGG